MGKPKKTKNILYIFGTRPEALKLATLILKSRESKKVSTRVCLTAQHREMIDQVLAIFQIRPDYDLNLMTRGQSLAGLTQRLLQGISEVLDQSRPDLVVVQGDTTTAFAAALAAFYKKIPVAHIEAGLRSHDKYQPFPEEINRSIITRIADLHLVPTKEASGNLLREGVPRNQIFITGNTIVDALQMVQKKLPLEVPDVLPACAAERRILLVTAHRRESFGKPMVSICKALARIAKDREDVLIVYPAHPNPEVQKAVKKHLTGCERVLILPPLDYVTFLSLMIRSYFILTDSGGIQEEAPSLHKPVLVLRDVSERPDGLKLGVARLVGTDEERIYRESLKLLKDRKAYERMSHGKNPYGDGQASGRILNIFHAFFKSRFSRK